MGDQKNPPSGQVVETSGTVVHDATSCGAAAVTLQTVTIPGARVGDIVLLAPPSGGLSVAVAIGVGYVSADDTAKVPFINPTAGALDPASATYSYRLLKPIE